MSKNDVLDRFRRSMQTKIRLDPVVRETEQNRRLTIDIPTTGLRADEPASFYAHRINELIQRSREDGVLLQSVIVSAIIVLRRILSFERQLVETSISLAQREKIQLMIRTLEATIQALQQAMSDKGARLLSLCQAEKQSSQDEHLWWFALTETMQALEAGTEWIASVVSGQPRGSAARGLGGVVARLLHRHYGDLMQEAENWMIGTR